MQFFLLKQTNFEYLWETTLGGLYGGWGRVVSTRIPTHVFQSAPKYRISRINYRKKFCCNILGDIINFNSVTRYMNKFVLAKHINVGAIHLVQLQTFQKINISYPLKRTSLCAYQEVRNVGFSEHFPYALNE